VTRVILAMLVTIACTASDSERARAAAEHRQTRDSVLGMEVVQSLKTLTSTGRLIYERPVDLSYDSLRVKRPDLMLTADRIKR
jgi:hypothetical protein